MAKKLPYAHHRTIFQGYIFATKASTVERNLLNSYICSTCSHSVVNLGPLAAEIGWRVWGTPANLNDIREFVTEPTSINDVNQTLHDVRPSPGLVHYIYTWGGALSPNAILPGANSLCVQRSKSSSCVLLFGTVTARHSSSGRQPNFAAWYKE